MNAPAPSISGPAPDVAGAERSVDLAILGGGLAGGLVALALARLRPELSLVLVERGERLGGSHVWSMFESDAQDDEARSLIAPLVARRWPGYGVRFPGFERRLASPYCSITSERLDAAVRATLPGDAVLAGTEVSAATPTGITLADGTRIAARGVIDARGATAMPGLVGGYQVFLGRMLELAAPHGLTEPVVMDARVEQIGGYRFVYVLPFSEREVFVEDTYYADAPALDAQALRARIDDYARTMDWEIRATSYEETGVLPVIAGGDHGRFLREIGPPVARAGTRAALVHPLTSYSLPDALRFAFHLARLDNLDGESLERAASAWASNHWREGRFYRMLTKLLYAAARPDERWRVLARFYRLPAPLIERFYAGRSTRLDRLRILAGRPPVPMGAALAALAGHGRPLADLGRRG